MAQVGLQFTQTPVFILGGNGAFFPQACPFRRAKFLWGGAALAQQLQRVKMPAGPAPSMIRSYMDRGLSPLKITRDPSRGNKIRTNGACRGGFYSRPCPFADGAALRAHIECAPTVSRNGYSPSSDILALGVVHHRAVAADIALGGFGLVKASPMAPKAALAAAEAMRSSVLQLHGARECSLNSAHLRRSAGCRRA